MTDGKVKALPKMQVALWVLLAFYPLYLPFMFYEFGAFRHLFVLSFFFPFMFGLVGLCLSAICNIGFGIWRLATGRRQFPDLYFAMISSAFFIILAASGIFTNTAFRLGAKSRIDSLGGADFMTQLHTQARLIAEDGDPGGASVGKESIPEVFLHLGAKYMPLSVYGDLTFIHLGVSGAFFPSGWIIVVESPPNLKESQSWGKPVYPGLYRWQE